MEDHPDDITDVEDWTAVGASASHATSLPNMGSSDLLQDLDLPERTYLQPPTESPRERMSEVNQSESDISTTPPPEPLLEIAPRISETGNPAILQTSKTRKSTTVHIQSSKTGAPQSTETPESTYVPTLSCNLKTFDYYDIPSKHLVSSGMPILFLVHTVASSSKMYINVVKPPLKEECRIVLLDLPGHEQTVRRAGKTKEDDKLGWTQRETLRVRRTNTSFVRAESLLRDSYQLDYR